MAGMRTNHGVTQMAIDWDVIRALLLHAAPGAFGPPPGYSNDANLLWHKEILERFTLAEIKWMPGNDNPHFEGVVQMCIRDRR